MVKPVSCTTIEIEDYYGNTIGAFVVDKNIDFGNFKQLRNFEVADVDNDYIFNMCEKLIRVQKID